MGRMNLPLTEQFVLLAHQHGGGHCRAGDFSGAAELGDLLLWRRVQLAGTNVAIVDPAPIGLPGLDSALSTLQGLTHGMTRPAPIHKYVLARSPFRAGSASALAVHRSFLINRGFVQSRKHRTLGLFSRERFYPEQNSWYGVLGELRAFARNERGQDQQLLLLAALAWATTLSRSLPLPDPEREQVKQIGKGTEIGVTIRRVVESLS